MGGRQQQAAVSKKDNAAVGAQIPALRPSAAVQGARRHHALLQPAQNGKRLLKRTAASQLQHQPKRSGHIPAPLTWPCLGSSRLSSGCSQVRRSAPFMALVAACTSFAPNQLGAATASLYTLGTGTSWGGLAMSPTGHAYAMAVGCALRLATAARQCSPASRGH